MRSSLIEPHVDSIHKHHHLHHEIKGQVAFFPSNHGASKSNPGSKAFQTRGKFIASEFSNVLWPHGQSLREVLYCLYKLNKIGVLLITTQTEKGNASWWVNQNKILLNLSHKNRPERRQRQKRKIRNEKAKWGLEIYLHMNETRTTFLSLHKNQLKVSPRTQPKTWNFPREAQGIYFKLQV